MKTKTTEVHELVNQAFNQPLPPGTVLDTLRSLAHRVHEHLVMAGKVPDLPAAMSGTHLAPQVQGAMRELVKNGADTPSCWLLLALWVAGRPGIEGAKELLPVLRPHADAIDEDTRRRADRVFQRWLGTFTSDSWGLPRARPLGGSFDGALDPATDDPT